MRPSRTITQPTIGLGSTYPAAREAILAARSSMAADSLVATGGTSGAAYQGLAVLGGQHRAGVVEPPPRVVAVPGRRLEFGHPRAPVAVEACHERIPREL